MSKTQKHPARCTAYTHFRTFQRYKKTRFSFRQRFLSTLDQIGKLRQNLTEKRGIIWSGDLASRQTFPTSDFWSHVVSKDGQFAIFPRRDRGKTFQIAFVSALMTVYVRIMGWWGRKAGLWRIYVIDWEDLIFLAIRRIWRTSWVSSKSYFVLSFLSSYYETDNDWGAATRVSSSIDIFSDNL